MLKNIIKLQQMLTLKIKYILEEEVKCFVDFVDWKQIASELKKSKTKYRFPVESSIVFQARKLKFVNKFYKIR